MNLLQIRTLWRRQVHDVPAAKWDDSEADAIINLAYALLQTEIFRHDPEAHLFWDHVDTVAGESWYPLPASFGVSAVGVKADAAAARYTVLPKRKWRDIEAGQTAASQTASYTRRGQWIGVFPAPAVGVDDGLEIVHTPVMMLSGDTDVPRVKLPLHVGIVWQAAILVMDEADDAKPQIEAKYTRLVQSIPTWYQLDSDTPDRVQIEGYQDTNRPHILTALRDDEF